MSRLKHKHGHRSEVIVAPCSDYLMTRAPCDSDVTLADGLSVNYAQTCMSSSVEVSTVHCRWHSQAHTHTHADTHSDTCSDTHTLLRCVGVQ